MGRVRAFLGNESGTAAVEMALILPIALALTFVTFDGAYYMLCEQRAIKGVRIAARYAARLDLSHFTCPGGAFNGPVSEVQNVAVAGVPTGGTSTIPGWETRDVSVSVSCSFGQGGIYEASGGHAPLVRVSTRFEFPSQLEALGFSNGNTFIAAAAESPVIGL